MPPDGQMFTDRYELGPEIGRGGMAEVFLARDRLLDRDVAVKVLSPGFATDPTFIARFRREAQSAASLNHPNIVAVYDWGEDDGNYFIVMEYVAGRTLREVLRTYERLPAMEAARIGAEIADALSFAHRNGVVHRDVKPGNVLLTAAGQVKVTDFGIARAEQHDDLTKTGSVMGTATYFSPEQAQGLDLDGRADVYALGVVLYEMLTGVAPFIADSPVSVAYKHVREEPVPPSQVTADVPGAMDRIVLTAMAKDPNRRYQSADDLRADLLRFERGTTTRRRAQPPARRPRARSPARRISRPGAASGRDPARATAPAMGRGGDCRCRVRPPPRPDRRAARAVGLRKDHGRRAQGRRADRGGPAVLPGRGHARRPAVQGRAGRRRQQRSGPRPGARTSNPKPVAGSPKGSTVTLTVSSNTITVPDIIGKTTQEAASIMQQKRLTPSFVERDSPDKPPGTVTETVPPAGQTVPKAPPGAPNTVITVYVAQEPPVAIPDVKGQDPAAATTALNQAGFLTVTRTDAPSDTVPVGMVIGTDPPAGTLTQKSTPIKLLVSTGPDQIEVPNVVGMTQDAAASLLLGLGFNVPIVQSPSTPANKGKVFAQSPPAGTKLKKGDSVTITVGL